MPQQRTISAELRECVEAALACAKLCLEGIHHCLRVGEDLVDREHVTILQVCAEVCTTTAHTILLGSDQYMAVCRACFAICEECADSSEAFEADTMMLACAAAARRAARACRAALSSFEKRRTA